MIRAIMHGCNGAMGQVISRLAKEDPEVEIVAGIDLNDSIYSRLRTYCSCFSSSVRP